MESGVHYKVSGWVISAFFVTWIQFGSKSMSFLHSNALKILSENCQWPIVQLNRGWDCEFKTQSICL